MRRYAILLSVFFMLIAWNTTAQIEPPWVDNVLYVLEYEPQNKVALNAALTNLHFSLIPVADGGFGEPCAINGDSGSATLVSLQLDLCETIGVPEYYGFSLIDGTHLMAVVQAMIDYYALE